MAIIKGTTDNDRLDTLTTGNDTVYASLGHDYIIAGAGNDIINAGYKASSSYWRYGFNDFDTVEYSLAWSSYHLANDQSLKIVADLEAGSVGKYDLAGTLLGTDTLIGVDCVNGTRADDKLYGRNFWSYEQFRTYNGNDFVDGRGGFDGVNYAYFPTGFSIQVNMAAGTVNKGPNIDHDTLRQIEVIVGTNGNDRYDATGYGGSSVNRQSYGEKYNEFAPAAGNDTVTGNGATSVDYGGVGGAITVDLGLLLSPTTVASIRTGFVDDARSDAGFTPGRLTASSVNAVSGGGYNDKLQGGGRVNTGGASSTVSGDASFESFAGYGGNDTIDGKTGYDRASYGSGNQTEGIVANLAGGRVSGDRLLTGIDTLRGIESIGSSFMDDVYVATGYTLSNAATKSVNSGDVVVVVPAGETLPSRAFNEFRVVAGNDRVTGNGATRVSFAIGIEQLAGTSVIVKFSSGDDGSARYGLTDGGLGTVAFSGVYSVSGGAGNDAITGNSGFQELRGYYGNDTILGGAGSDVLAGHLGDVTGLALNLSTTFSDDDWLDGGAGNDLLRGDFGNDTLVGGLGADTLAGGTGLDRFRFVRAGEGGDRIADFRRGQDKLAVVATNFGLVFGSAAKVVVNGAPSTATGTFLYTSATGVLRFDADGTGAGAAVTLATLLNRPATLAASDFVVGR